MSRARFRNWCLTPFIFLATLPLLAATSEYKVELPAELRRMAARGALSPPVSHAAVTIALPDTLAPDANPPVLVVSATSDAAYSSSRRLLEAYSKVALENGWIVVAADPGDPLPPDKDNASVRLALNNAALAVLRKVRPKSGDAPLAFAGFSGGAKYSGWLAAAFAKQGRAVVGIYLSGCNEDTVSSAATQFDLDARFKRVPVFVQAGATDEVATPEAHREVAASIQKAGFSRVKLVWTPGGHRVEPESLGAALGWFGAP